MLCKMLLIVIHKFRYIQLEHSITYFRCQITYLTVLPYTLDDCCLGEDIENFLLRKICNETPNQLLSQVLMVES